jgi:hypothetical protein
MFIDSRRGKVSFIKLIEQKGRELKGMKLLDRFQKVESRLVSQMSLAQTALLDRTSAIEPCRAGCRGFENLGRSAVAALTEAASITNEHERRDFSRALIARLAQSTLKRADGMLLTPRILDLIRQALSRLADFLEKVESDDYSFPADHFCKDYRFVTLLTIPCGAQVVDLSDGIGPKTALKLAFQKPLAGVRAARSAWFRPHTESRYLDDFNDAGWQDCYRLLAGLLELYPAVRGMVATSWFYDPALSAISPRLTYLRKLPVDNGARLVMHGTTDFDVRSATSASPTRRALYEAGKYKPVCCSVLWDRRDLIAWAANTSATS